METKMKRGNIGVYIGIERREKRSELWTDNWSAIGCDLGMALGSQIVTNDIGNRKRLSRM
jgi:hypothetical protein